MQLLDLPLDVFAYLISRVTKAIGTVESLKLRQVSQLFCFEVQRSILSIPTNETILRHAITSRSLFGTLTSEFSFVDMPDSLKLKLVLENTSNTSASTFLMFWTINAVTREIAQRRPVLYSTSGQILELKRTVGLCMMAHFRDATFKLMTSEMELLDRRIKAVKGDGLSVEVLLAVDTQMPKQKKISGLASHVMSVAAFIGDLDLLTDMVHQGAHVDDKSDYFGRPILNAAGRGFDGIVRHLLSQRAHVVLDGKLDRKIHRQEWYDSVYDRRFILSSRWGESALDVAAYYGQDEIVEILLKLKHRSGEPKHRLGIFGCLASAACVAACGDHPAISQRILKTCHEQHQDQMKRQGDLLVRRIAANAAHYNGVKVLKDLIDRKALSIDALLNRGETALIVTADNGHLCMAKMLLELGADPQMQDRSGNDALSYACIFSHHKIADLLLETGLVDINKCYKSAFAYANPCLLLYHALRGQRSQLRYLIDRGAIKKNNALGDITLQRSVLQGRRCIVECLLEAGVSPYGNPNLMGTPMITAQEHNHPSIVELLESYGVVKLTSYEILSDQERQRDAEKPWTDYERRIIGLPPRETE